MNKRKITILCLSLLTVAAVVSLTIFWMLKPSSYDLLKNDLEMTQKEVNFPLYAPSSLPEGFFYKQGGVSTSGSVVLYSLSFEQNKTLSVSIQAKPPNIDFNDFYNRILSNKSEVLSTQGKAVIGNNGERTIGSLVNDKVWVVLNTQSHIKTNELSALLSSLKPL